MNFSDLLGESCSLAIRQLGAAGALLAEPDGRADAPCLPLSASDIPEGARVGDLLTVFVTLDSEDRALATTRTPKLYLGQVAFLEITDLAAMGAFADWGLAKELLIPFAEQTVELYVGARQAIGLYVDKSGRLAGTMRVAEMLGQSLPDFAEDEWVSGEAWRDDPELGLFVIVERAFVGLLPSAEPHRLARGDARQFRVSHVLPDGKLELSLRRHAHEELESDAEHVLAILSGKNRPRVGDHSSADAVRALFGLSKKAFKRAAGRLLKSGALEIDADGCFLPRQSLRVDRKL